MSGHSPVSHHEMFEFKDAHSTPPSTSKEPSAADTMIKESVLVDTTDDICTSDAYSTLNSRSNFKYIDSTLPCIDDKVPLAENEDLPNTSGTTDDTTEGSKLNEDKPDGNWPQKDEKDESNNDDLCLKCLYVSMQCCECSII